MTIEEMRAVITRVGHWAHALPSETLREDALALIKTADTLMRALREACGTDEDMKYCIAQAQEGQQGEGGGE